MSDRVRIVHVSDPHLASGFPFHFSYLTNKRLIGYLNLVTKRRKQHKRRLAFAMCDVVRGLDPDHLVITGDFTNIALDAEFELAAHWVRSFGLPAERIMVLPGNHDAYIGEVWKKAAFARAFRQFLPPAVLKGWPWGGFPLIHRVGPVTLLGLSSSVPCPPFLAWGRLGSAQLQRLRIALERESGAFRMLAVHHPVDPGATRWDNALLDAAALRDVVGQVGAELVITGHLHRPRQTVVSGPEGAVIPVFGVGSASLDHESMSRRAQFRVLDVTRSNRTWTMHQELWGQDPGTGTYRMVEAGDLSWDQLEESSSMGDKGPMSES